MALLGSAATNAEARGAVTVSFTPQQAPTANYAPNNVIAVWVEGPGGYIRTLDVQALVRTQYLLAWNAVANGGEADAVSSATRAALDPVTVTWNLMNLQNVVVPDGTYTIQFEMAQSNATNVNQNRRGTFTFNKNGTLSNQTPTVAGFTNVTISYDPNAPACGDGIVEGSETCDPGVASGQAGACTSIVCPATTDGCNPSRKLGSSTKCNVTCGNVEITTCANFDACCLPECEGTDNDCDADGGTGGGDGGVGGGSNNPDDDGTVSGGCEAGGNAHLAFALPGLALLLRRKRRAQSSR